MVSRPVWIAAALAALVLAAAAGGVVVHVLGSDGERRRAAVDEARASANAPAAHGGAGDVDDVPLGSEQGARVRAAALAITGGGRVVEIDRSEDPGEAYEVEVVRDGREIDVALDAQLRRVPNVRYDGSGGRAPED